MILNMLAHLVDESICGFIGKPPIPAGDFPFVVFNRQILYKWHEKNYYRFGREQ
jgi:hypothetical protein